MFRESGNIVRKGSAVLLPSRSLGGGGEVILSRGDDDEAHVRLNEDELPQLSSNDDWAAKMMDRISKNDFMVFLFASINCERRCE